MNKEGRWVEDSIYSYRKVLQTHSNIRKMMSFIDNVIIETEEKERHDKVAKEFY